MADLHQSRWWSVAILVLCCVAGGLSCITSQEVCVKNAFIQYQRHKDNLECPDADWRAFIAHEVGNQKFVATLRQYVNTKYSAEVLYCLGCFGDKSDAATFGRFLEDADPEIRRIALTSFSRLVGKEFPNAGDAKKWFDNELNHRSR